MFRVIFIILFLLFLISSGLNAFFYFKWERAYSGEQEAEKLLSQKKELLKRCEEVKEKFFKKNQRLQDDAFNCLRNNNRLTQENEELKANLKKKEAILKEKEKQLTGIKEKLSSISKDSSGNTTSLQKELSRLKKTLLRERALYNYNLGVAYSKAGMIEEAILAYEKSLEFDRNNPEAHYNLGLLYEETGYNLEKAIFHYQKYLELKPQAEDRKEVEAWIEKLKEKSPVFP